MIILSVVVIFAGSRLYSQYREQVIRTEESQLLTMAGIVGNNLNSYMEQQLEEIDLFYSREGMPENVWAESGGINARTAYFLKNNAGVYNWITVTEPDGTKFRYEPGKKAFRESADGEVKAQCGSGDIETERLRELVQPGESGIAEADGRRLLWNH